MIPAAAPTLPVPSTPSVSQVLLVNDTTSLRRLKRWYLEQASYTVAEVLEGRAALEWLQASDVPVVVVMNTRIPYVDGTGILRAAAADKQLQRHAFVLTTALAQVLPDELFQLTRRMQVPVLGKPFTEHELLVAVASQVRRLRAAGDRPEQRASDDQS